MADEITVKFQIKVVNGNNSFTFPPNTTEARFDQTSVGGPTPGYLTIGTSEESEAFSELGTTGWLVMQNLDATNYVEWGFSTGVYGGRMEAGEPAEFRLNPGTTLYLKANASACKVVIYALED